MKELFEEYVNKKPRVIDIFPLVVQDIEMLKFISWEAIIIDSSQQSSVLKNLKHIKVLATDKKLLLFCQIEVNMHQFLISSHILTC